MELVRIPKTFFFDHLSRELPTPLIVKQTARHIWIDRNDPDLPELIDDADFYTDPYGPEDPQLRVAARALLRALKP